MRRIIYSFYIDIPERLGAPKNKFESEETSEYHPLNINKYPEFKKFMDKSTIIYKEDTDTDYFIVCKNKTCSPKLNNLEEFKVYLDQI